MKTIISTNPGKGYEKIGQVQASSKEDIIIAVELAKEASKSWSKLSLEQRKKHLARLYSAFETHAEQIQQTVSKEVGKTLKDAKFRFEKGMELFSWCLENVDKALQPQITHQDNQSRHSINYEPYGVTAIIAPWNHPFQMFLWGVIPNLLAGNTVVFKHSEECPLTGLVIDRAFRQAELPLGVFNQIYGDREEGKFLLDQDIDLIWFTGSTAAGQNIFEKAGKKFVKSILELGGSNATIVFEDIDIDDYRDKIFFKRFGNCGQSCDALKRLLVHESILDKTLEKLKTFIESKNFGPNDSEDTDIGPLSAKRQLELIESQINDAVNKGAKVITGGKRSNKLNGAYFEPTIITNLNPKMRIWQEEVFGPSLSVIPFKTEQEAIEIANCTEYGLGAIVFSKDLERAKRVALKLEAGTVEINQASHWQHCNPFGGYKKSGMGREHGILGFREITQVKVISEPKL